MHMWADHHGHAHNWCSLHMDTAKRHGRLWLPDEFGSFEASTKDITWKKHQSGPTHLFKALPLLLSRPLERHQAQRIGNLHESHLRSLAAKPHYPYVQLPRLKVSLECLV